MRREPRYRDYDGSEPANFVLDANIHRRMLTSGQRATIAVDFLPDLEVEAKARQEELGRTHGANRPQGQRAAKSREPRSAAPLALQGRGGPGGLPAGVPEPQGR